jgi:hypothetical protein
VKIGTGLTINSTTGVLSATGLDFDEADPVFTASAAYGITSTDITNWNDKASSNDIVVKKGTGNYSIQSKYAEAGAECDASGNYSFAFGYNSIASGLSAVAIGGRISGESYGNRAVGQGTAAIGGSSNLASEAYAFATGYSNVASGQASFVANFTNEASGSFSTAFGSHSIANHSSQFVFGRYNIADDSEAASTSKGSYVEIVGNGSSSTRSNARTLDWSGNEWLAGKLTVGVVGVNPMDVATISQIPTSLPASDVFSWAKASTKPTYTFSEIGSKPTTLSGYGIADAYTKTEIDGLVAGVLHYKGTKASVANLPTTDNVTGDVWHITADGSEYAWDGSIWQELGTAIDLSGYAQLAGASFTGPVTFGDSVTADELNTGDLVVTGAASFANNIQANTINGVAVGNSPKFTDTNTDISTLTLATDTGTSSITLTSAGKYKLTAGTKTVIFTMPTIPTDTNTWRTIQVNDSDILGSGINTGKLNLKAGTNISLSNSSGTITITGPDLSNYATLDDIGQLGGGTVTSITLKAGSGIVLDIDNTAITTTGTRIISHSDTSSQASVSNSGRTYIQSITLDGFGHVTALSSATETVTNTDTKLQVAAVTSGTTYYPIVGTGTTAATRQYDTTGFIYKGTNGTTSTVGSAQLTLGNSTASGTANNKQGQLIMYGSNAKKATITLAAPSADISLALPTSGGTLALTSQIPTIPTSTGSNTTGITATTTATETSLGTASSIYGVKYGTNSTTTASKASGSNGSASTWVFEDVACDDITAWSAGSGSASFSATVSSHVLSFSHSHTHTAPSLTYSAKTASHVKSGGNGTAPSWSFTDVTVPIRADSATSVPNVSVASATVSITDPGHTHTI